MTPKRTAFILATAAAVLVLPGPAHAAVAPARTTVTIEAAGTDLSGTVSSPRQACVTDRKVVVFKQVGTRGGGDDQNFASDQAEADGSWSTGNTGTEGKFYAKVRATTRCKGDSSPTIRAQR